MIMENEKIIKEINKENFLYNGELSKEEKEIFDILGIFPYKHQIEAFRALNKGKNVVLASPTGSGKTEAYLSYIIKNFKKNKKALILFPTKALARDQLMRLNSLRMYGITTEIYDGDTPSYKRSRIRQNLPSVLITNFDMLHFILLNNQKFKRFFDDLEFVVVDELHTYSGTFGTHVYYIIKRLKRLTKNLQFFSSSATIQNPKEFAEKIFNEKFLLVKGKGNRIIEHHLILPRDSYITHSLKIAEKSRKKTLIFANGHNSVERLGIIGKKMGLNIAVYRAGLNKRIREKIEEDFKKDKIRILATTSALELGIDIGSVENIILAGFPGTITQLKQRVGRARGRGKAFFVARDSPLDIYYYENENEYINGKEEKAYINTENEKIKNIHYLAMAKERVLMEKEIPDDVKEWALSNDYLKKIGLFFIPTPKALRLINKLNIRSFGRRIIIYEGNNIIGEREEAMAINELYEGAIYLHGGNIYVSEGIDLEKGIARVKRIGDVDYYTSPLTSKEIEIIEEYENKQFSGFSIHYGKINVSSSLYGFVVKETFSSKTIGKHEFIDPYEFNYDTFGFWLDLEEYTPEGLHAFEHIFIAMSHSLTGTDPKEIGGLSYNFGRMFVYEGVPEGNGATKVIFEEFEDILKKANNRLFSCKCEKGCPKCILDPMCGNDNKYLDKEEAKRISKILLENIK